MRHDLADILAHERGREGQEGDQQQQVQIGPDERRIVKGNHSEGAMMQRPEGTDYKEADDEADEVGKTLQQSIEGQMGLVRSIWDMRNTDFDDQQRDRDGEHRIREENQPLQQPAMHDAPCDGFIASRSGRFDPEA